MKRRNFLNIGKAAAAGSFMLNGLSIQALSKSKLFAPFIFDPSAVEDRILVLIQLHGGNDGLNLLLPIEQYADYFTARADIAIPDTGSRSFINVDGTLPLSQQMGLHPDLQPLKDLYDQDKMSIIHSVGYDNHNQSHFRSRDVWWMGADYDEYKSSGWMGRYLDYLYPNYPTIYPSSEMPDPIGLEIGSTVSLGYHRANGIPMALATKDPENFSDIVSGIGGPALSTIPDNHYGSRMGLMNDLFDNAEDYATQLQSRWNAGANYATYPGSGVLEYPNESPNNVKVNSLAWQLQTVARLINGGCKTKIYLVKHTGFDTHDFQVDGNDPTVGRHAALLYHLANAVKAFQDDLEISQNDEKVVTVTFSEFGRRVAANGSYGTDHGTAAPMLAFGPAVKGGMIGTPPSITNLDSRGNLMIQTDYRQVFTTLLSDWLGADETAISATEFTPYLAQKVDLIENAYLANPILPVDLLSLRAYQEGKSNVLVWKTANELELSHFILEKSKDGSSFEPLCRVEATGKAGIYEYDCIDDRPYVGNNYYRLLSVDIDGSTKISDIVSLYVEPSVDLKIFPNPVADEFTLSIKNDVILPNIYIRLMDTNGRLVFEREFAVKNTSFEDIINIESVTIGHYIVQVTTGDRLLYSGGIVIAR